MTDGQDKESGAHNAPWPPREENAPLQDGPPPLPAEPEEGWLPADDEDDGFYYKAEAEADGLHPQDSEAGKSEGPANDDNNEAAGGAARRRLRIGRNLRAVLRRGGGFKRGNAAPAAETLPSAAAIVPQADLHGFALIAVIAIMSFLAAWMVFAVHFIGVQAAGWRAAIVREAVVQIMPAPGRDIAAEQKRAAEIAGNYAGVAGVRIISAEETKNLLAPWLGENADIAALPVPRLVLLELAPNEAPDYAALSAALRRNVPGARLDNHQAWAGQLARGAHIMQSAALALLALVLAAMMLTVIFATRGACVSNAHIIEVLHFIGAEDDFIASRFDAHFFRAGLKGAAFGGLAAAALLAVLFIWISAWRATPEGSQMSALFGRLSWDILIFAEIAALILAIAALTMATAHWTIMRRLYHMDEKSSGFSASAG